MADWKIARRQGLCSLCTHEFEDGERHASTLSIVAGELQRRDLCPACFRDGAGAQGGDPGPQGEAGPGSEGEPAEACEHLFWWYTHHRVSGKKTVQLDLESLERLFVQLEGRPEPHVRELRYVLCLLLMRKRRVKVDRIERGGEGESFLVHRPRRKECLKVIVYDFDADRMAELRTELQAIFDGAEDEEALSLPDAAGEGQGEEDAVVEDDSGDGVATGPAAEAAPIPEEELEPEPESEPATTG